MIHTICDIFFRGRHNQITTIIAIQDDDKLPAALRKNAFLSIFTEERISFSMFVRKPSNSFDKEDITQAKYSIHEVFKKPNNNKKLVYSREGINDKKFYYTVVPVHEPFQFCAPHILEYCKKVENPNCNMIPETNTFAYIQDEFLDNN